MTTNNNNIATLRTALSTIEAEMFVAQCQVRDLSRHYSRNAKAIVALEDHICSTLGSERAKLHRALNAALNAATDAHFAR